MALTPKQAAFVGEYLTDLNATAAYARAGYKAKGHAAESAASHLLRNVEVAAAIAAAQQARAARTELTQDWVVERLTAEAKDDAEGSSQAARIRALELLGRHLGMWPNKLQIEQRAVVEVTEVVCRTRKEANAILPALGGAG